MMGHSAEINEDVTVDRGPGSRGVSQPSRSSTVRIVANHITHSYDDCRQASQSAVNCESTSRGLLLQLREDSLAALLASVPSSGVWRWC